LDRRRASDTFGAPWYARALSRRTLLRGVAATGLGATAAGLLGRSGPSAHAAQLPIQLPIPTPEPAAQPALEPADDLDVAVIGGGIGGLYAAWRLLEHVAPNSRPPRVALFEAGERLGGRLYSVTPSVTPHLHAEMGGMRYGSDHPLVTALVERFALPSAPFGGGDEHNLLYLRGVRLTRAEVEARSPRLPYELPPAYQGLLPSESLGPLIQTLLGDTTGLTAAQVLDRVRDATVFGSPLVDWDLVTLMDRMLPRSVVEYMEEGRGYAVRGNLDHSAGMITDLLGTPPVPTYRHLVDGYQALPLALADAFTTAGGRIEMGARLQRLDRIAGSSALGLVIERGDSLRTVRAGRVILALPRRALELLDQQTFLFDRAAFRSALRTVDGISISRMFLTFDRTWWEPLGVSSGFSVTDLPIRQCMYFGTEGDQPGADPSNRSAMMLATYTHGLTAAYWQLLMDNPPLPGTGDPYPSQGDVPADIVASRTMVEAARQQIADVHGIDVPAPTWAAYIDWARDPFGGGVHSWNVGARMWDVAPFMRRPVPDAEVFICGEAWSVAQGWVEGALQTTEHVLQDHLGLRRPAWLPADAWLGP
jgi:lysine 2-monooxygenase